ncbi:MAG: CDP-diacylglycerol--glycerol-3-phosphate 3-phosphatidyltransferase [Phycisphaerales bacterium]|nr:CDP-diacylglycerol--glycerol-3-phosphate 3-phosphatidyltransferase [Phycisphaerales bacterium]MCB9835213.1 CDP-diacylglycerol--glycerol-3-phosphate 3-phosphatidyltransferase [Phycisphaera sp.]
MTDTSSSRPRATGWRLHTPNTLVGVRLALSVGVFSLLSQPGIVENESQLLAACACFVLAAITDALDGMLARKWNAITRFGRVMDPLADKVLVMGSLILLTGPTFDHAAGFTGWMVIVILTRELLVTSLRGMLESEGVDASANRSGKIKMILQSVSIPLILLLLALAGRESDPNRYTYMLSGIKALAWLTTIATALSAGPYITRAAAAFKKS